MKVIQSWKLSSDESYRSDDTCDVSPVAMHPSLSARVPVDDYDDDGDDIDSKNMTKIQMKAIRV